MSETAEISDKDILSSCATELLVADSEDIETSKGDTKLDLEKANIGLSLQKDSNFLIDKEQIDNKQNVSLNNPANPLPEMIKSVSVDETKDTPINEDLSTSLNNSSINNFKDSDPCSEDMVLRYDDSEISEFDNNSDQSNDKCSQNAMHKTNDNILEELDKLIAKDQSDLESKDDGELVNNDVQNQIILNTPLTDLVAAQSTFDESDNKSLDETDKVTKLQAEIIEELNIELENKMNEPNILKETHVKVLETSLLGAGDGFIEDETQCLNTDSMQTSNFVQPADSDNDIIHSIDKNHESVQSIDIIDKVSSGIDLLNSEFVEKMDIDEDKFPVMQPSEPMEVTNYDTVMKPNENVSPLATDTKSELVVAEKMESLTSDLINPEISETLPIDSSDITENIPSLGEAQQKVLLDNPDPLLPEKTLNSADSETRESISKSEMEKSNELIQPDQQEQEIIFEKVTMDNKLNSAESKDITDPTDTKIASSVNAIKVTDQLSVDIPKFITKQSDFSKEVDPQALQLAQQSPKAKSTETQAAKMIESISKDVSETQDSEPVSTSISDDILSADTKVSDAKDIEAQKAEIAPSLVKESDVPASDVKLAKSDDAEISETEKPKSKDLKPESSDATASEVIKSVTESPKLDKTAAESKGQELQSTEIAQPSTKADEIDAQSSKTILSPSKPIQPAIPEEPQLKSPEPSTSKDTESQEMQPDQSDEVPDTTDSLGLLAETFRSTEDGDEQEESPEEPDDEDGEDDDDDSDHDDDEESNQIPDNSEDSNIATNSETDHDANPVEQLKSLIVEAVETIQAVETLSGDAVESSTDIEIEEDKIISEIDLAILEQDELKLPKTPESLSDNIAPKEDNVEKSDITNVATTKLRAILTEVKVQAESENVTPTKTKKLEISKPKNIVNIVELEESSSEDDVQDLTRPTDNEETTDVESSDKPPTPIAKPVRINTSEITIKTTSVAAADSTLVIPEIKVAAETSTDAKPKCGLEVFNLDSDEDSSGKEKLQLDSKVEPGHPYLDSSKAGDCVNPMCDGTSSIYMTANAIILRYYDAKKKKSKTPVVCENCAYHVASRMEHLMEGVKCCDTRLLSLSMESNGEQLVEISDSDSDSDRDDKPQETVGSAGFEFLDSTFAEMVNSTWMKYNLTTRMADAKNEIVEQIDQLEKDSKELNEMLSSCQKLTDKVRNDLYAAFARPIHNLPPIEFDENGILLTTAAIPYNNDDSTSETEGPVRRSKRTRSFRDEPPNKRAAIPLGYKPKSEDQSKESKDDDIKVVRLSSESAPASLPPQGELRRAALRIGMPVYGMRHTFGSWSIAHIESVGPSDVPNFTSCRVKFENKVKGQYKQLLGRHLAYAEPADVRLTIGTRVIALFIDYSESKKKTSFYSGVIAEVPNPVNLYRYLVFFDDGYAQYVQHADIRVVCETSSLVWEEVHTFSREFVKSYLLAYPERPMVRLHAGQSLKTEWNGKWWPSTVLSVDASLVNVFFEADKRTEWIYRGSTRLAPLFIELQAAERPRHRALHSSANRHHKNMPYVEYTRTNEQDDDKSTQETQQQQEQEEIKRQRAVAKKSTMQPYQPQPPSSVHQSQSPSDGVLSRVVYYTPKAAVKPHKMQPHTCSIKCKRTDVLPLHELRTYNPLARPLLSGWERQIVRFRFRKEVVYRAPCGRRLRNVQELHKYLRDTYSDMSVDLFDFNPQTHCLAEFVLNRCLVSKKDLSHGKENVPVPCVNYYDSSLPEFCSYNTERTPTTGVPLNTDPDFLCGCDCTDDCQDKSKCACWKLTMEGANTIGMEDNAGYVYKRLLEPVPTGIYECNSRCKCSKTCLNRVAQHPLQLKLQVFKTANRGWGIRALNDVPKGAFLCVYAGNLLTDATANLDGLNEGDEYLAELDYIEVVEQMKEGYEDDVPEQDKRLDQKSSGSSETSAEEQSEEEEGEDRDQHHKDEDFRPDPSKMGNSHGVGEGHVFSKSLRKRARKGQEGEKEKERDKDKPRDKDGNEEDCITISDDEEVRKPSRFNAEAGMDPNEFVSRKRSVRSFFGKDEACYIVDAKVQGNIGRYLNHSCTPNVFVQNVFVDTHDPRFPWVAFFALCYIKAGTELTWNYNYDIGSVPGKVLYCYCGAPNCRRRLL